MAGRESISDLYLRLGLQYDELQSNFVDAQSTIQTNMARIARENTTIRLQAQVDISGLDEASDAAQIFNIRTRALNQQIDNQRDRVNMANAQLRNMATAHGENSDQAQRARIAYERERLALANLERELRNLNETQNQSNSNSGDFIENLQGMAEKAAPVVAGITAIAGALKTAADYSVELIEKFRELQNQAYELNMPFGKSKEFLRQLRLGGGDYGDFQGYIRGITDAYVKGEVDDPEFIALSRYGAQITDASGKLKDFKDITEEVYQAYKKAKAEGNEIEFLQLTGGESGITDAIQFFQRYEEAKEDAAKIFDSGINPDELRKSERALNLLTEQMGEFKDAMTDVITPATQAAMEGLFEVFHSGTQFIAENKEEIRQWGAVAAEIFSKFGNSGILSNLETSFSRITDKLKELSNTKLDFGDAGQNAQYEKFLQGFNDPKINVLKNDFFNWAPAGEIERATVNLKTYNAAIKETGASYADIIKNAAQALSQGEQLSQYGIQRMNQYKDELEDLKIELKFGDDEYGKAKAQNDLWLRRAVNDQLYVSKEEETAARELHAARDKQIEQEKEDRINEIREQSAQLRRTDLENALAEIEDKKEKWINAGMEEAEATQLAEQQKAEAIEQLESEWAEHINSIYQTSLENRLAQIEKEKQAWIQKGVDEVKATQAAEEQKAQIQRDAAMSVLKSQIKEYRAFQQGGYEGLRDYNLKQLYKSGIRPEDLYMTPQQLATFQKAQQVAQNSLLPNFMTDNDRANQQAFRNAQYDAQEKRYQEKLANMGQKVLINGEVPEYLSEPMWRPFVEKTNLAGVSNNLDLSAAMSNMDTSIADLTNNITSLADNFSSLADNLSQIPDSLSELPDAVYDATGRLEDFSAALNEIELPDFNNLSTEKQPVHVNVNVQITEAHAWDSEHIQELADKVADQIEPAIVNAVGGDSNSY